MTLIDLRMKELVQGKMEITPLPMVPLLLSSIALVPTPVPLAEDHQVDHVKVSDIRSILCPDHQLNLESGCEHCEGAKTTLHNQFFKALRVVDQSASSIPDASKRFLSVGLSKKPALVLFFISIHHPGVESTLSACESTSSVQ